MAISTEERGLWSSKLGFVVAAAGSAVGLGNIWSFPNEVAENGGAAFLLIYLACCFLVGFPLMTAELTIGRHTRRNPVGAFKSLSSNPLAPLIGFWGVLCGVMILAFYNVIAGIALSYVFTEFFHFTNTENLISWFSGNGANPGLKNALFSVAFMGITVMVVTKGISGGIERAAKILMPILLTLLVGLIFYVAMQPGSGQGFAEYLKPDLSEVNGALIFDAMGQAFFSLSLGMGALITYGSYLNKKQNIAEAAAYVTLADLGVAFIAGLLIIPAMYLAAENGIPIFGDDGSLLGSDTLVFSVLPDMFHSMPSATIGLFVGISFFVLLSVAALTSTISLLEVPTSYAIDELGLTRGRAAMLIGGGIATISVIISFNMGLIGTLATLFNDIGLPLGGVVICLFLGYVWKTGNALDEIEEGYPGVHDSMFGKVWPIFVKYICPVLILIVFVITLTNVLS